MVTPLLPEIICGERRANAGLNALIRDQLFRLISSFLLLNFFSIPHVVFLFVTDGVCILRYSTQHLKGEEPSYCPTLLLRVLVEIFSEAPLGH